MARRKYELPDFLVGTCSRDQYLHWLDGRAQAHVRRDRGRGNHSARRSEYKEAIHKAVVTGGEFDAYTGEKLDWSLIGTYDNQESRKQGRDYKKEFALLPTVDHVGEGQGSPDFMICGWRTNDSKHDLDLDEFLDLCRKVLKHHGG
jgi:hypothetical protein